MAGGEPARLTAGSDPLAWFCVQAAPLRELLAARGAVVVTDLPADTADRLALVRQALGSQPATCAEPFAGCRSLGEGVHTAPDWDADREMCLHHEQSQALRFPSLLIMAARQPATSGGATLLGDTRQVLMELPAELVARFRARGWRLTRNYRPHLGMSWTEVFRTRDPARVEETCAATGMECSWQNDGTLHTVQRRSAVVRHPVSDDECWFNQIGFFSQWSVPEEQRSVLLNVFGPDGMPFNTGYGDGDPLTEDEFRAILLAYDRVAVRVDLRPGEVLLVDNLAMAHGRDPYTGVRDHVVALADPMLRCDMGQQTRTSLTSQPQGGGDEPPWRT